MTGADLALRTATLIIEKDAVRRVGEPDGTIRLHHHVIGRVEALALVTVGHHADRSIEIGARHAAGQMLAGDEAALAVDGVAIGIVRRVAEHRDRAAAVIEAQDAVVGNVRPDEVAPRREPRRPLRPASTGPQPLHPRVADDAALEARIENLNAGAFELAVEHRGLP